MKIIQIVIDCGYMVEFEHCENFIWFAEKAIKSNMAKRKIKGIRIFDCLSREIILSGRSDAKTVFNLAMMASDIMDIIYEYNQARKEHGENLFVVDIYAYTNSNGFVSKEKYLCRSNDVQRRK